MKYKFDVDRIVKYLLDYRDDLENLYSWNPNLEGLVRLKILSNEEISSLNSKSLYFKEVILKEKLSLKLQESYISNKPLFEALCLWIVKDWGGISTAKDENTISEIYAFLESDKNSFKRISSISKVMGYMFPEEYIIYDSRVAYALNWIILSQQVGNYFFPIPNGRNSKMMAFDMNVLIRLKHVEHYHPSSVDLLSKGRYVYTKDRSLYISNQEAYKTLNSLIRQVNNLLWDGKKSKMLYNTEMLLFSIADKEIFSEITERLSLKFNTKV